MSGGVLKRLVGTWTIVFVGLGVAIGSGVFTTPGDMAGWIPSPGWMLVAWIVGGVITYLQALVTAELATRFPRAGAEYQYLREAYGDFAAFFFGWSFTIFVTGAGTGVIAAGLGRIASQLSGWSIPAAESVFGCLALALVTAANVIGLRAGAAFQNLLTILKVATVVGIGIVAWVGAGRWTPAAERAPVEAVTAKGFLLGLVSVMWSYSGATDSAKLAEEMRDVQRRLPRALASTTICLTAVYVLYQYGLLCAATPQAMRGSGSAAAAALGRIGLTGIREFVLIAGILVCLGSISSTILSNVRVTFALARDGLAPAPLARMNAGQSPVWSQVLAAGIAAVFVWQRSFTEILGIYFVASTILYGMAYVSLIVFRERDRRAGIRRDDVFLAPGGVGTALFVTSVQLMIAIFVATEEIRRGGYDWLYTLGVLAAVAGVYPLWRRMANGE